MSWGIVSWTLDTPPLVSFVPDLPSAHSPPPGTHPPVAEEWWRWLTERIFLLSPVNHVRCATQVMCVPVPHLGRRQSWDRQHTVVDLTGLPGLSTVANERVMNSKSYVAFSSRRVIHVHDRPFPWARTQVDSIHQRRWCRSHIWTAGSEYTDSRYTSVTSPVTMWNLSLVSGSTVEADRVQADIRVSLEVKLASIEIL